MSSQGIWSSILLSIGFFGGLLMGCGVTGADGKEDAAQSNANGHYQLQLNLENGVRYRLVKSFRIAARGDGNEVKISEDAEKTFRLVSRESDRLNVVAVIDRVAQDKPRIDTEGPHIRFDTSGEADPDEATYRSFTAAIDQPVLLQISSTGNIESFTGLEELAEKMCRAAGESDSRKKLARLENYKTYTDHYFKYFPPRPVAVGESWEKPADPFRHNNFNTTYTLMEVRDGIAVIKFAGESAPVEGEASFSGKESGTWRIDLKSGWPIEYQGKITIRVDAIESITTRTIRGEIKPNRTDSQKAAAFRPYVASEPRDLGALEGRLREAFIFEVTGTKSGSVWGSGIYTLDSRLGKAAVHAGVIQPGESGLARVVILPGQDAYQGTERNDVSTSGYGSYRASFRVERVPDFMSATGTAASPETMPDSMPPQEGQENTRAGLARYERSGDGQKANVSGKYSGLLRVIEVPGDQQSYGEFNDYGYYSATSYGGHKDLPSGYWVYVKPRWYIWKDRKESPERRAKP